MRRSYKVTPGFQPHGAAKSLPQLALHFRHHYGPDVCAQVGVLLFHGVADDVRHRERQPRDDEQRDAVTGEIDPFPARPRCEQHGVGHGLEQFQRPLTAAPRLHRRERQMTGELPLYKVHELIAGEQQQRMTVAGQHQRLDLGGEVFCLCFQMRPRGQVEQAVVPVVERRGGLASAQAGIPGKAELLLGTHKAAARRQCAGGEQGRPPLWPEVFCQCRGRVPAGGAERDAVLRASLYVEDMAFIALPEKLQRRGGFLQPVDGLARQTGCQMAYRLAQLLHHGSRRRPLCHIGGKRRLDALGGVLACRGGHTPALAESGPKGAQIAGQAAGGIRVLRVGQQGAEFVAHGIRKTAGIHLADGVRQLVRFVHDQRAAVFEQRRESALPVADVGQQVIVVADLKGDIHAARGFEVLLVAAPPPAGAVTAAEIRHTDMGAVKGRKAGNRIHVAGLEQLQELGAGPRAGIRRYLFQPLGETDIADKALFAFADHAAQRLLYDVPLQQHGGKERQILLEDGILQGDAGGGYGDGLRCALPVGLQPEDAGDKVSVGLADAGAGIAEQDVAAEQGIQHLVAKGDLAFPHSEAVRGQEPAENGIGPFMGRLDGIVHKAYSLLALMANGCGAGLQKEPAPHRRVKMLKDAGFNAIRSSHNPCSRALLDACDKLGVYVMDEAWDMWYNHKNKYDYASQWRENYKSDLLAIVSRDYNHPSVILYSIGNEVSEPARDEGVEAAKEMVSLLHEADPTRPVTGGFNLMIITSAKKGKGVYDENGGGRDESGDKAMAGMNSTLFNMVTNMVGTGMNKSANSKKADAAVSPVMDALDICGYNYASGRYPLDGKLHPDRLIFGSETFPQDIAKNWEMVKEYPYLIGDFMWTAWDYLGEAGLGAWGYTPDSKGFNKPYPWLLADTGAMDILGNPNGEMFLAQAAWGQLDAPKIAVQPINHDTKPAKMVWRGTNAIPSWSWRGCEGKKAVVEVYTNQPTVELFQDGKSLRQKKTKLCKAVFKTAYHPGRLEAVSFDASGREMGRSALTSANGALRLTVAAEVSEADTGEIVYIPVAVTDENGVVESNADSAVAVTVEGGELLAFGSADPRTEDRFDAGKYTTYYGRALAVVRTGVGDLTVTASDGKTTARAVIKHK